MLLLPVTDVSTTSLVIYLQSQSALYHVIRLWRWLLRRLSKRQSLLTTTVLFRITFTQTIKLNLLLKRARGLTLWYGFEQSQILDFIHGSALKAVFCCCCCCFFFFWGGEGGSVISSDNWEHVGLVDKRYTFFNTYK